MSEWQPIETAPKDGTEIDLWAERCETGGYERVTDCSWGDTTDWDGTEYSTWLGLFVHMHRTYQNPTHWMPLPAAPSPSQE